MGSRVEKKSALEYRKTSRQGSSVVEQGTHKPLVGSSTLPPGNILWLGCTYFEDLQVVITLAQPLILMLALRNTCGVTRTQRSGSARESKSSQARTLQR